MATLNRLKTMSDADIQLWLTKVEKVGVGQLVKGLLGADAGVRQCVLRNMSEQSGSLLTLTIERVRQAKIQKSEMESGAKVIGELF